MANAPKRLFKYQRFSDRLLEQLCLDRVYYAEPAGFNDPLDCQPVVIPDMSLPALSELLKRMIVRRATKEVNVAVKRLRLRDDKVSERRDALVASEARRTLGEISYNALNPEIQNRKQHLLGTYAHGIEGELRKAHEVGVLCLSGNFNSPLMWSHYADQHRGVCVEYDVSGLKANAVHRVSYDRSRAVKASQLREWLFNNDTAAERGVQRACLLTKAWQWSYEREWRLLGEIGLQESPVHLKSVIFGMRCPYAVEYAIVKALLKRGRPIKFWKIAQPSDHFVVRRERLELAEMLETMPRTSAIHEFAAMPDEPLGA